MRLIRCQIQAAEMRSEYSKNFSSNNGFQRRSYTLWPHQPMNQSLALILSSRCQSLRLVEMNAISP